MDNTTCLRKAVPVSKLRPGIDHGHPEPDRVRQASQRDGDVRAAEDEQLRGAWEGLEEHTVLANRLLTFEQPRHVRIDSRQQHPGARRLAHVGLEHHGFLYLQRVHQVTMHLRKWLDQNVDFAAAAEADPPGEGVADAVVKEAGRLSAEDPLRPPESPALPASAADRRRAPSRPAGGPPLAP